MTGQIRLPDGTTWVRPSIESDAEHGLGWKLRYAPDSLTRGDQLTLAQIVEAYGYLLLETTRDQRDRICRGVRVRMHQPLAYLMSAAQSVVVHCEGCGNDLAIARVGVTECPCGVKHTLVTS